MFEVRNSLRVLRSNILRKVPFILSIVLAFCDCSAINWVLNPIGEFIAQQSRELKKLLEIASINGALGDLKIFKNIITFNIL